MADRPNIVLICVDQMRYDCMSIAGHPVIETPTLDSLASRGVRFTQAHTATASCIAARAALMTGLGQRSHGRIGYRDGVTWNYPVTMAGEMAKAGYQTVSVGKMHCHPQRNPMGFEELILHDGMLHYYGDRRDGDYESWLRRELGSDCEMYGHGVGANAWVARPWHLPEYTHPTYWVTSRAIEFLHRRDKERPFFLYLSFVAPHPPLVPPQCYFDQYMQQGDTPAPPVGDWVGKMKMDEHAGRWDSQTSFGRLDPRSQKRAAAGYYGQITQIDHQIFRLMEHVGEVGASNTVYMFTSDHGEMLGDHHFFRKTVPYAGSIRVPLVVRAPSTTGVKAGTVLDHVVELRDIMPTVLDFAGAPIPAGVEGLSLLPLMQGKAAPWRPYLHGEHAKDALSNHYIHDGRFKYIWYSQTGMEQLFDTVADPQELHDLVDESAQASRVCQMRTWLVKELTGREEGYSDGQKLVVGRKPQAVLSHIL